MKKLLSITLSVFLLTLVLSCGVFGLTVNAATEGYYTYSVSNGEVTIKDVDESISGEVEIPETLGGYPV
ncbi:MAG: hypothetical protein IIV78_02500, partial [Oscillospiraceae bacterium]|nr:hypothetical protein [Oscillospiraceae bacterium]